MNNTNNEQEMNLPATIEQEEQNENDCGERPECESCDRVWEFNYPNMCIEHEGVLVGESYPLVLLSELAEILGAPPERLVLRLATNHLPVYNVGETIYIDPYMVKYLLQINNICVAKV